MSVDQPPEERSAGEGSAAAGQQAQSRGTDSSTAPSPAVRGRPPGRRGWIGAEQGSALTPFLGWFSVALGAMQLLAPRSMTQGIGLRPTPLRTTIMRACGARELAAGSGILSNPTAKEWLGMRVGGDLVDLGLLGIALMKSERPSRTLAATAAVAGVTLLDILGMEQLAERRKTPTPERGRERGSHVLRSVTVERPIEEVYAYWRDFSNLPSFMRHLESVQMLGGGRSRWRAGGPGGATAEWESELVEERENEVLAWRSVGGSDVYNSGEVRFARARDGGTVITVELRYAPPGGRIGAAMLKLFRREPGQQVGDDLRRFKQILETGEVLLSDASALPRPHAAQPPQRTLH